MGVVRVLGEEVVLRYCFELFDRTEERTCLNHIPLPTRDEFAVVTVELLKIDERRQCR